jgi:hypothetical protein
MTKRIQRLVGLALALGIAACGNDDNATTEPTDTTELRTSTRAELQWKRYAAMSSDLGAALELDRDEVCSELGMTDCIRQVHLVPLGGNDPIAGGLHVPSAEPLATTPAAIDRILLSACSKRAALDREAGDEAKVFKRLPLGDDAPSPGDARVLDTVTELYRRLLARDPEGEEQRRVAELAVDDDGNAISAEDFATLACFAIGTTTENLFF